MIAEIFLDPKRRAEIARGGRECVAVLHAAGVSAVYEDPASGLWIVHHPDGAIHPAELRAKPEALPDSVIERLCRLEEAHPAADVVLLGSLADDL